MENSNIRIEVASSGRTEDVTKRVQELKDDGTIGNPLLAPMDIYLMLEASNFLRKLPSRDIISPPPMVYLLHQNDDRYHR